MKSPEAALVFSAPVAGILAEPMFSASGRVPLQLENVKATSFPTATRMES